MLGLRLIHVSKQCPAVKRSPTGFIAYCIFTDRLQTSFFLSFLLSFFLSFLFLSFFFVSFAFLSFPLLSFPFLSFLPSFLSVFLLSWSTLEEKIDVIMEEVVADPDFFAWRLWMEPQNTTILMISNNFYLVRSPEFTTCVHIIYRDI